MAKGPKISIADQLASIAATSPRDHVDPRMRENVSPIMEGKPLEANPNAEAEKAPLPSAHQDSVSTSSRDRVTPRKRGNVTEDGLKIRQRIEKPHVSLYAHPRVLKKLREIAVAEDCKPHDLYVQGLRLVLKSYGYDLDKLESGEG